MFISISVSFLYIFYGGWTVGQYLDRNIDGFVNFFQNLTIYYQKILTMRYKTGQFNRQENRDMIALRGLSEAWKEVLYTDMVDTIYGTRVDALCGNWTGGTVAIEIKYREQGILTDT